MKKVFMMCVLVFYAIALCVFSVIATKFIKLEDGITGYFLFVIFVLVLSLMVATIMYLINRIQHIRKLNEVEKMTDPETGLGNLQFFKYHFKHKINEAFRNLYHITYIILDISYLRTYHNNASYDNVLKYAATVLSENTSDRDIIARISENGFVLAFQSTSDEAAFQHLTKIMNELNDFEDMKDKKHRLVFQAATYHMENTDRNCETLLFNLRKNCIRIINTEKQIVRCDVHTMNETQEEKQIKESILNGLKNTEFKMYLQFIVDNKTKKITSAEALSRWDKKENGILPPGKYIGNLETTGLITEHDLYIFDLVCKQLQEWQNTEFRDISISCNFTRMTLSEENLINNLKSIADLYSFDRSKLSIEITEDAIEKDRQMVSQNVMKCKELGFKISLDDIGSGYTSLSNLCDYPIDVVKIDRDILLKTDTQRGKDLVTGIISLAHNLGIKVVCEGVELEEHNNFISKSDCDYIQGWYYSKPVPQEEYESFINTYQV